MREARPNEEAAIARVAAKKLSPTPLPLHCPLVYRELTPHTQLGALFNLKLTRYSNTGISSASCSARSVAAGSSSSIKSTSSTDSAA